MMGTSQLLRRGNFDAEGPVQFAHCHLNIIVHVQVKSNGKCKIQANTHALLTEVMLVCDSLRLAPKSTVI